MWEEKRNKRPDYKGPPKKYLVVAPCYSQGMLLAPGDTVVAPADRPPSKAWVEFDKAEAAAPAATVVKAPSKKSDKDL